MRFGRYELLEHLASGGMAEVFLARSASLDGFEKTVVIKRIRPDLSANERFFSMFIEEARISITFSHPNIVQVFDFGCVDDCYFIAMEYVHGCDINTVMKLEAVRDTGIEPGLALFVMDQVCRGLDYAHNHIGYDGQALNVVHRDVSPSNILLGFQGGVKVADFGIAKARGKLPEATTGKVMGKLFYMSPEHATGKPVDRRADVFSVGLVLWGLLCGRRVYGAFPGQNFVEQVRRALVPPPSEVNPKLPALVDEIVLKAVARRASDRYASAEELGRALHAARVRLYPDVSQWDLLSFLSAHRDELHSLQGDSAQHTHSSAAKRLIEAGEQRTGDVLHHTPAPPVASPWEPTPPSAPVPVAPAAPPPIAMSPEPSESGAERSPASPRAKLDELEQCADAFRATPNLWTLVKMGKICARHDDPVAALAYFWASAVKFAQRGLLAQALLCSKAALRLRSFEELRGSIADLKSFVGQDDATVLQRTFANGALADAAARARIRDLLAGVTTPHRTYDTTPLLSSLSGEELAELCRGAKQRHFRDGQPIVEQGSSGRNMFLVGAGRVVVHATGADGERIYLSSLMAGDFFGENGFFTGAPRSATVSAEGYADVFQFDRALYDRIMEQNPEASEILLRFYKDRIVDTVLAKSSIFGLLPTGVRRTMIRRFGLRTFGASAHIIEQGDTSDQIYLIKNGTAAVYVSNEGVQTKVSELGPGTLFGEIAALRGVPRTASVVATTELEVLELGGADFTAVLSHEPELRARVEAVVEQRYADLR